MRSCKRARACNCEKRSIRAMWKTSLGCLTIRTAASWDQMRKAVSLDTAAARSVQ